MRARARLRHGLSEVELAARLRDQGGVCAICGTREPGSLGWTVDHDHALAEEHGHRADVGCRRCVRGILCDPCNRLLGAARDRPSVLSAAVEYLLRWAGRR
jgi:hypothetical protein